MQRLTVFAIIFRASSDRCSNYQHALGIFPTRMLRGSSFPATSMMAFLVSPKSSGRAVS
jgi:hypothetical protein